MNSFLWRRDDQLVLRPEFASSAEQATSDMDDSASDFESPEVESDSVQGEDQLVTLDDDEPEVDLDQFSSTTHRMLDLVSEQHAKGNSKFVERVIKANSSNTVLLDEIDKLKASRTMRQTWSSRKHPATMYYK